MVLSKSVASDATKSIELVGKCPTSRQCPIAKENPKQYPGSSVHIACLSPRCGVIDVACARSTVIKRLAELTDAAYGLFSA